MAITKDDAVVSPYVTGQPPTTSQDTIRFLMLELRKLEQTIQTITDLTTQVAISEPSKKLTGMIRWNKAPWDPLGTGDGLVKWNGSAWTAV
jgi:hypothetical protein